MKSELEYQGMLLKELAAKCGVSKNTLGNYLTGHNSLPTADTAVKIARALGVSVEYLVTGETPDESHIPQLPAKYRKILSALPYLDQNDLDAVTMLVTAMKKRYCQSAQRDAGIHGSLTAPYTEA